MTSRLQNTTVRARFFFWKKNQFSLQQHLQQVGRSQFTYWEVLIQCTIVHFFLKWLTAQFYASWRPEVQESKWSLQGWRSHWKVSSGKGHSSEPNMGDWTQRRRPPLVTHPCSTLPTTQWSAFCQGDPGLLWQLCPQHRLPLQHCLLLRCHKHALQHICNTKHWH